MSETLTMVPLAKIKTRDDFNPRREFGEEQMAELVASVKRHGIITPLTLAPDGDGFTIIAGERRYRAAKAARLKEVPAQVREADGEALTLAVAENVIRADLNPVEEAEAYARLVAEHGDAAKVAKLVGRSEKLIGERMELLRLPDEARALVAARRVPLACAPALVRIAEAEPLLADLTAAWLAERPHDAALFPADPGEFVDDVLRAEWQDDQGQPLHPVAYSVSEFGSGPVLPRSVGDEEAVAAVLAKLGEHAAKVAEALAALPEIAHASEYDWSARQAEARRWRDCFSLDEEDADAARAFGCLLELRGRNDRSHAYVTDPEWLADRIVQKIAAHAAAEAEDRHAASASRGADRAGRRREGGSPPRARAPVRGARLRPRAQPRPRRSSRPLAAEARHRRGQAARLARPAPLRQGGGLGASALRRAADDHDQAGQDDRPLSARRGGRAEAPRRGDRGADAGEDARGGARGCPAPAARAAAGGHRRAAERRPAGDLRAARVGRVEGARQARPPRSPGLGQAPPCRARG